MSLAEALAKRPRCPTHDRPLLRLYYNTTEAGRRVTGAVEWAYCPDCKRVFPSELD